MSHGIWPLVGLSGLGPPTSRLSGVRSNRLSYKPMFSGFEATGLFATIAVVTDQSIAGWLGYFLAFRYRDAGLCVWALRCAAIGRFVAEKFSCYLTLRNRGAGLCVRGLTLRSFAIGCLRFPADAFATTRGIWPLVEINGIEPLTSCLQSRRSPS